MPMMGAECIWQTGGSAAVDDVINANGNSGPINVQDWANFLLLVSVGAPAGTNPTLAVHLDGLDAFGNTYQDLCSGQPVLSFSGGAAQNLQATMGLNAAFVASTAPGTPGNYNLLFCAPDEIVVRWVIGGTGGPSFPDVGMSLYAR
jgi:hypothetical protein